MTRIVVGLIGFTFLGCVIALGLCFGVSQDEPETSLDEVPQPVIVSRPYPQERVRDKLKRLAKARKMITSARVPMSTNEPDPDARSSASADPDRQTAALEQIVARRVEIAEQLSEETDADKQTKLEHLAEALDRIETAIRN